MDATLAADIAAVAAIPMVAPILRVIADVTGMRFVCVARVTEDSWAACAVLDRIKVGIKPGDPLDVTTTLCRKVRTQQAPVVINHASLDPEYCDHPTPKLYNIESYLSFPLYRADGSYFGSLCAIDPLPRTVSDPAILRTMSMFAQLISLQIDGEKRHAGARTPVQHERETAELREQFIAVLGHDVRTPLASIVTGAELLRRMALAPESMQVVERIGRSAGQVAARIDDVLDFTRGRMGGEMAVERRASGQLRAELYQVIAELQSAHAERSVQARIEVPVPVMCDSRRLAQLLANLLKNALVHGTPDQPVDVLAFADEARFVLSVTNRGPAIPDDEQVRLFQPFRRGARKRPGEGLGLGLYIAAEIARSHGGRLDVHSDEESTCFTFTMPTASGAD